MAAVGARRSRRSRTGFCHPPPLGHLLFFGSRFGCSLSLLPAPFPCVSSTGLCPPRWPSLTASPPGWPPACCLFVSLLGTASSNTFGPGVRLVDDFLAKSKAPPCASFADTADVVAKVAFKMFLGVPALVGSWSSDRRTFSLVFTDNPLAEFTELPEKWGGVWYSNVLCGVIKGALEMVGLQSFGGLRGVGWGLLFENLFDEHKGWGGEGASENAQEAGQVCLPSLLYVRCSCAGGNHEPHARATRPHGRLDPLWSYALTLSSLRSLWLTL